MDRIDVREGVGRRGGTSFNGDDLGNATEEMAPGETRHIWDIARVGKGVLFLEGCKDGIWLGGWNAARSGGNGQEGVECTDWRLRPRDLRARAGKRDLPRYAASSDGDGTVHAYQPKPQDQTSGWLGKQQGGAAGVGSSKEKEGIHAILRERMSRGTEDIPRLVGRVTKNEYPVLGLGHAGVRVLGFGLEFASTGLRRQTRLIPISRLKS